MVWVIPAVSICFIVIYGIIKLVSPSSVNDPAVAIATIWMSIIIVGMIGSFKQQKEEEVSKE